MFSRIFGNRSYCYYCLEQYPEALTDAERAIQLDPDWPKGHFRQGRALMGLKVSEIARGNRVLARGTERTDVVCVAQRYSEAEGAMEQVLKLDTDCEEAAMDLLNCRVLQLMVSSFTSAAAKLFPVRFASSPQRYLERLHLVFPASEQTPY